MLQSEKRHFGGRAPKDARLVRRGTKPSVPLILFHYTNTKAFLKIVESRTLRASSVHCLNDALEYRYAFEFLRAYFSSASPFPPELAIAVIHALEGIWKGVELQSRFVASFSEVRDDLSQWRAYGRPAPGFSIGFDPGALGLLAKDQGFDLVPCIYDEILQTERVTDLIQSILDAPGLIDPSPPGDYALIANEIIAGMVDIASYFKHPKFEGEKEWRLVSKSIPSTSPRIKYRAGTSLVVPYLEITLAKKTEGIPAQQVLVGPSPIQGIPCVTAFDVLAANGCDLLPTDVKPSAVPFRDW